MDMDPPTPTHPHPHHHLNGMEYIIPNKFI